MNKKAALALLVAAGLMMTTQSASAVVGGPKAQQPDQMVITVVDENGQMPDMGYDPSLSYIMIDSPELANVEGHWSKDALHHLVKAGVLTKNEAASFEPDAEISKEDFQVWTNRILGKKDGAAEPADALTRLDAAVWLAELLPALNTGINGGDMAYPFTDTNGISAKQKESLHYLYKLGIMVGDGHGKFSPKSKLSKGEAAVLVDKVLSRASQFSKPANYEVVTGTLPQTVYTLIQENQSEAGVYTVTENGVRYVVIAGGEQPNPGYTIDLQGLGETDGALFVNAGIKAPDASAGQPAVIAYPVLVLKVAESAKPVFLLN